MPLTQRKFNLEISRKKFLIWLFPYMFLLEIFFGIILVVLEKGKFVSAMTIAICALTYICVFTIWTICLVARRAYTLRMSWKWIAVVLIPFGIFVFAGYFVWVEWNEWKKEQNILQAIPKSIIHFHFKISL